MKISFFLFNPLSSKYYSYININLFIYFLSSKTEVTLMSHTLVSHSSAASSLKLRHSTSNETHSISINNGSSLGVVKNAINCKSKNQSSRWSLHGMTALVTGGTRGIG